MLVWLQCPSLGESLLYFNILIQYTKDTWISAVMFSCNMTRNSVRALNPTLQRDQIHPQLCPVRPNKDNCSDSGQLLHCFEFDASPYDRWVSSANSVGSFIHRLSVINNHASKGMSAYWMGVHTHFWLASELNHWKAKKKKKNPKGGNATSTGGKESVKLRELRLA